MIEWIIYACIGIGLLFNALGVIGVLRFPDVYTRLHAETKTTTFGTIFLSLAVIVAAGSAYASGGDAASLTLAVHTAIAAAALASPKPPAPMGSPAPLTPTGSQILS